MVTQILVTVQAKNKDLTMEVDTGAVLQLSASQPTSPHSLLVSDLP